MTLLKVSDLVIGYGRRPILNEVSFHLSRGSSCLVTGQNGAGKTTLLRTLVGLQTALRGNIQINDRVIRSGTLSQSVPSGVRFLGQGDRGFRRLHVTDHRRVLARLYGFHTHSDVSDALNSDPRVGSLSIGQRRMEAIRLLDCEPVNLFVLDEPTAGVDPKNKAAIKDWMKSSIERGKSFIVVEHDYDFFSGLFDKLMIVRSPDVVYFDDMLPSDQINRLIS